MWAGSQAMLDRIVMNVVGVPSPVVFVSDAMLPEPPLPDAAPSVPPTRVAALLLLAPTGQPETGE